MSSSQSMSISYHKNPTVTFKLDELDYLEYFLAGHSSFYNHSLKVVGVNQAEDSSDSLKYSCDTKFAVEKYEII